MVKVVSEEADPHHHRSSFCASRGVLVGSGRLDLISRRFRSIFYGRIYGAWWSPRRHQYGAATSDLPVQTFDSTHDRNFLAIWFSSGPWIWDDLRYHRRHYCIISLFGFVFFVPSATDSLLTTLRWDPLVFRLKSPFWYGTLDGVAVLHRLRYPSYGADYQRPHEHTCPSQFSTVLNNGRYSLPPALFHWTFHPPPLRQLIRHTLFTPLLLLQHRRNYQRLRHPRLSAFALSPATASLA